MKIKKDPLPFRTVYFFSCRSHESPAVVILRRPTSHSVIRHIIFGRRRISPFHMHSIIAFPVVILRRPSALCFIPGITCLPICHSEEVHCNVCCPFLWPGSTVVILRRPTPRFVAQHIHASRRRISRFYIPHQHSTVGIHQVRCQEKGRYGKTPAGRKV